MFQGEGLLQRRRFYGEMKSGIVTGNGPVLELPPLDIQIDYIKKGRLIYHNGWPAKNLVVLRSGRVYAYRESFNGRTNAQMFSAPSVLGHEVLDGSERYRNIVVAFDECTIQRLTKTKIPVLLSENPEFATQIMAHLLAQEQERKDFLEAYSRGVPSVIALTLLSLVEGKNSEVIGLAQDVISELSTCTRAVANKTLGSFCDNGVISYVGNVKSHRIKVLQPDTLHHIAKTGSFP